MRRAHRHLRFDAAGAGGTFIPVMRAHEVAPAEGADLVALAEREHRGHETEPGGLAEQPLGGGGVGIRKLALQVHHRQVVQRGGHALARQRLEGALRGGEPAGLVIAQRGIEPRLLRRRDPDGGGRSGALAGHLRHDQRRHERQGQRQGQRGHWATPASAASMTPEDSRQRDPTASPTASPTVASTVGDTGESKAGHAAHDSAAAAALPRDPIAT